MTCDLPLARGGLAARTEARVHDRAVERLRIDTGFRLARLDQTMELEAARLDGIVFVAKRGMEGVGLISQVENQLAAVIPGSSARVQYVADRAVLAIGDVVSDTARNLRRGGR